MIPDGVARLALGPVDWACVGLVLVSLAWTAWDVRRRTMGRSTPVWVASLPVLPMGVLAAWAYAHRDHTGTLAAELVAPRLVAAHGAQGAATALDAVVVAAACGGVALGVAAAGRLVAGWIRAPGARITGAVGARELAAVAGIGVAVLTLAERGAGSWVLVLVATAVAALGQSSWVEREDRQASFVLGTGAAALLGVALAVERRASRWAALVWADPGRDQLVVGATDPTLDPVAAVVLPLALGGAFVVIAPRDERRWSVGALAGVFLLVAMPALLAAPSSGGLGPDAALVRLRAVPLPVHPWSPPIPGRLPDDCVDDWPGGSCGVLAAPADAPIGRLPDGPLSLVVGVAPAQEWPEAVDPWRYTWVTVERGPADVRLGDSATLPAEAPSMPRVELGLGEDATVGEWVHRCLVVRARHPRARCVL